MSTSDSLTLHAEAGYWTTIATGQGAHQQILTGAQNVSIGSLSSTAVGGNYTKHVSITHTYPSSPSTSEGGDRIPQCSPYEIVNWLKAPNFRPIQQTALAQRMLDTGIWFVESAGFQNFTQHKGSRLWGTGMPGAGKTVLSAISVEYLEKAYASRRDTAVTFAFLRYNEGHSVRDIIAALLSQLVSGNQIAFTIAETMYARARTTGADPAERDLLTLLGEVACALERLFVAIDGLDEAVDNVKDGLLLMLPPMGVNLLITSRPLPLFVHRIPNATQISIQARTEDIAIFVSEFIRRSSRLDTILRGRPDLIRKLSTRIKESSQGMFLVARLQMEVVMLNATNINSIFRALDQLPANLDQMYDRTLERVNAQPAGDVAIARRVFAWMVYARVSLSIRQLQSALCISFERQAYDLDDESPASTIIAMCGGLITVEKHGGVERVRFVHYTTREYVAAAYFPNPSDGHAILSVSCAIYLDSHPKIYQSVAEVAGGKPRDIRRDIRFGDLSKDHSLSLWYYALHNWGEHASLSQQHGPLHPYLLSFLAKHQRHYWQWPKDHLQVGGTALHFAMRYRLLNTIKSKGLPSVHREGSLAVNHHAARHGDFEVFEVVASTYGMDAHHGRDTNGDGFLHVAVRHSQLDFVKRFMSFCDSDPNPEPLEHRPTLGNYINEENAIGDTPLAVACRLGDVQLVRLLASHKDCRPNFRHYKGGIVMAFEEAAKLGDWEFFQTLLPAYEKDTIRNIDTPLHTAVRHGHVDFVQKLTRICGTDATPEQLGSNSILDGYINEQRNSGETPLMIACQLGNVELVRLLASHTACQPNLQSLLKGETALMMACRSEDLDIVRLLASREDCQPNVQNCQGETALMIACRSENIECVRFIVSHRDCQPNIENSHGETALRMACLSGNIEVVRLLTSHKGCQLNLQNCWRELLTSHRCCQPNLQNRRGETALTIACRLEKIELIQLLLSHKRCRPNRRGSEGETALMIACRSGNIEGVRLLTSHEDCQPNVQNSHGEAALMIACRSENIQLVQLLLSHKQCQPNLQGSEGETALMIACRLGNVELVRLLLSHNRSGCQPNLRNTKGETALMMACRSGNGELVRLLTAQRDCQPNLRDSKGETALFHSCTYGIRDSHLPAILLQSFPSIDTGAHSTGGTTPFMKACETGKLQTVRYFLDQDSSHVAEVDDQGRTALMRLFHFSFVQRPPSFHAIFNLLLAHGSSLDKRDHAGMSAFLHAAGIARLAYGDILPCLTRMYETDAIVINHSNSSGQTALMIALALRPERENVAVDSQADAAVHFILSKPELNPHTLRSVPGRGVLATVLAPTEADESALLWRTPKWRQDHFHTLKRQGTGTAP